MAAAQRRVRAGRRGAGALDLALGARLGSTLSLLAPLAAFLAAALTLAALVERSGLAAWTAPLLGLAPWWPFSAAVLLALLLARERPHAIVPWRTAAQVAGMLILIQVSAYTCPPSAP